MPQLTERDAENLSPGQAVALVHVIDLHARWDGMLAGKGQQTGDLLARQKASDAYVTALRGYAAAHPGAGVPEPSHAMPDRLGVWCRVLRVVFGRAEGGSPAEVMGKVCRLADQVAERMGKEKVAHAPANDLPAAVRELGVVIAWCDALVRGAVPVAG